MSIKDLFISKKVFIDVEDSKIKNSILNLLSKSIIVEDEKEADICISDKDIPGYVKVGSIFSLDFLKAMPNLQNLGIYKNMYIYFPYEVFKKEYDFLFFYLFMIIASIILPFIIFPVPPDDLLRHLVVYKYDYDYSKIFINTLMPSWDFYLPFDFLAGKIHYLFSIFPYHNIKTYGPFFFFYYLFLLLSMYAVKVNIGKVPKTYFVFFLSLFYVFSLGRIFLGRPTVLSAILFLIALGFFIRKEEKKALIFTSIIPAFYYLFFIYLIPLIFFSRKVLYILIAGLIYWSLIAYAGEGNYFIDIYKYILSLDKSLISVGENTNFMKILSMPFVLLLIILTVLYFKSSNKKYIYPSFWFLLSNQIRYFEVIGPSLLFALKNIFIKFLRKGLKNSYLAIFLLSTSIFIYVYTGLYSNQKEIPPEICSTIEGKKVKARLGSNFFLVYYCDNVKVNPSMEVRWTKNIDFEKKLIKGEIDCRDSEIYKYDYLYEDTLKGSYNCLDLIYRDDEYTLWKVKHEKNN